MSNKLKSIAKRISDNVSHENIQGIFEQVRDLSKKFEDYFGSLNGYEIVKIATYVYCLKREIFEKADPYIENLYSFCTLSYEEDNFAYETCETCDGDGYVECDYCDGRGTVSCENCEGEGEVECDVCDGSGEEIDDEGKEVECENCDGDGRERCNNCYGDGNETCDDCSGNGNNSCDECGGDGQVEGSKLTVELTSYISFDIKNKNVVFDSYELNKGIPMWDETEDENLPFAIIYSKRDNAFELQSWVEPDKIYVYYFEDNKGDLPYTINSLVHQEPDEPFTI